MLVEDIWQVGTWGRETYNRPGRTVDRVAEAVAAHLERMGFGSSQIGLFGDSTSSPYWNSLKSRLSRCHFVADSGIIERMQRRRSKREQAIVRAAAQLADIGVQAAWHATRPGVTDQEIYAAFTFAQMARGGEWGKHGWYEHEGCAWHAKDAGKPCRDRAQCESRVCLAPSNAGRDQATSGGCAECVGDCAISGNVVENGIARARIHTD